MKSRSSLVPASAVVAWIVFFSLPLHAMAPKPFASGLKQAPDFTLPAYKDSSRFVTLSQIAETKVVLIAFWASWCPTCVEEIPELNEIHRRYEGRGLEILGVNVEESQDQIEKFVKRIPVEFEILMDTDGKVSAQYGLTALPASVLIARGGKILYYGFSLPDQLDAYLESKE